MAVVNTPSPAGNGGTTTASREVRTEARREGETLKKKGNWFQQHKKLTIAGGAGVAILVLSHKGSQSSSTDSGAMDQAAQNAAAEQAAIDQAVGDATGLNNGGVSGGGDNSGDNSGSGTGSGGGNAGGGDAPPGTSAPPVIIINEPAQPGPPTTTTPPKKGGNKGNTGSGGGGAQGGGGSTGHGRNRQGNLAPNPPKGHGRTTDPFHNKGNPPRTSKKGRKPEPPQSQKPTVPKRKTHGSVMKHGRAFPHAISVHVGAGFTTSDGVIHEPVTVNYGGHSETHMSHNRGEAWTDNVPGYTPPSRGVPTRRLGTPPLVGADWDEFPDPGPSDVETAGLSK